MKVAIDVQKYKYKSSGTSKIKYMYSRVAHIIDLQYKLLTIKSILDKAGH